MIRYFVPKNPKILFIGINPHHGSFKRGVPFSNNKMFWYLLSRSGLIKETESEVRDDERLRKMYHNKFGRVYRFGLLNVVNRPSRDVSELRRGEEMEGRLQITSAIKHSKPKVVCFVGKVTFLKFRGSKDAVFGWQKRISGSKAYVMHFPIRGYAKTRIRELRAVYRAANTP